MCIYIHEEDTASRLHVMLPLWVEFCGVGGVCVCTHIYMYMCIYIYMHIHIDLEICIYVYKYEYVCMNT